LALSAYPKPADPPQPFTQPAYWADARFNHPVQPVVGVCWFEAQAYCRWLAAQAGRPGGHYRLPTEAEWDAAARGLLARRWPRAGNTPPERHQINSFEAGVRRTTPVGLFITSQTPEGVADLAGNVWEWTASPYTSEGLRRQSVNQVLQPGRQLVGVQRLSGWLKLFRWLSWFGPTDLTRAPRAVRGGGWGSPASRARAGYRGRDAPVVRSSGSGFRLVVCCPIEF
jgi:formylglycine-generating enzyme required for sulfatase activity